MAVRTRNDLARVLAPILGMTHQDAERYLQHLLAEMTSALKRGDEIVFRGFGRFTPQNETGPDGLRPADAGETPGSGQNRGQVQAVRRAGRSTSPGVLRYFIPFREVLFLTPPPKLY